ncbi:unnamed protein product, partial [Closterium sp. NIES-54]
ASAAAADVPGAADVGAASASAKRRSGKGKGGRGGGGGSGGGGEGSSGGGGGSGGGGSGGSGGRSGSFGGGGGGSGGSGGSGSGGSGGGRTGAPRGGSVGGQRQQQQRRSKTPSPQQLREWFAQCGASGELLRTGVAKLDLVLNSILAPMYALSASAEGDCYLCVPPDPCIEAAALGASESVLPGLAPAEALHTFTLDSGASHCFFRDTTTLTPFSAPLLVRLADPSGGPVLARSSTVLPCLAVPSASLSGLHLPSFSTNLGSTTALEDAMVTTNAPGSLRVSIYTCTGTGRHLATLTRQPRSSLYTFATKRPQVAASAQVSGSGQVAPPCSCRLLSHQTLLWHHCLGHPSLPCLRTRPFCGMRNYLGLQITRDRARRTITLTQSHMVHQVLQRFSFQFSLPQPTPLSTGHSLSAPPSDESVEPSGPYPELVGCLMYLMTCTRPDFAYPLSILARYVAPGRHRKVHWDASKRVLRYLCSTSGTGLVLGGRGLVVLTGHADASWVDDSATQRSSHGYTFSLGSGSISSQSTRSSSVLSSSCEAEMYARAMAAQELRWLTYLLTDLGEQPRSPPVLYIDNKAMIALCQEHRLEHRLKHIALRYFLARELQQPGQLRLAYVATRANTADIFTKALPPGGDWWPLLRVAATAVAAKAAAAAAATDGVAEVAAAECAAWMENERRRERVEGEQLCALGRKVRQGPATAERRHPWRHQLRLPQPKSQCSTRAAVAATSAGVTAASATTVETAAVRKGGRSGGCGGEDPLRQHHSHHLGQRSHHHHHHHRHHYQQSLHRHHLHHRYHLVVPKAVILCSWVNMEAEGSAPAGPSGSGGVRGAGEAGRGVVGGSAPTASVSTPAKDDVKAFNLEKFSGEDWASWSFSMELLLNHYGLLEVLDGELKRPANEGATKEWDRRSKDGFFLLSQCLSSNQLHHIKHLIKDIHCGPKAWKILKDVHAPSSEAMVVVLERQLHAVKINEGDAVQGAFDQLRDLYVKLSAAGLRPLGPTAAPTAATATAATTAATTAIAAPPCCATMASLRVLAFDHEGRPVQFDTWLDDLQLYLLSDSKDSVSLFDLASGAASAPPATADNSTRSQWLGRDTAARIAIRNHLPLAECAHFGTHRTVQALYNAVVAQYSSPATAALGLLLLPYLFPKLSAFATVEDLVSHLHASDSRYRAGIPAEFCL